MRHFMTLILMAACASGVAACKGDGGGNGTGSNAATEVTADDGAVLVIPANALPPGVSGEDIELRALDPSTRGSGDEILFAYELLPDGLEFSEPLTLRRPSPYEPGEFYGALLRSGDKGETVPIKLALNEAGEEMVEISIPHFSFLDTPRTFVGPIRDFMVVTPPPSTVPVNQTFSVEVRIVPRLRGETPFLDEELRGELLTWKAESMEYVVDSEAKGAVEAGEEFATSGSVGAEGRTLTFTATCTEAGEFTWTLILTGAIYNIRDMNEVLVRNSEGQVLGSSSVHGGTHLEFSGQCVAPSACCGTDGECSTVASAAECDGVFHEGKTCDDVDCDGCAAMPGAACTADADCGSGQACDPEACSCACSVADGAACASDADCDEGTCNTSSCACEMEPTTEPVCESSDPTLGPYASLAMLVRFQQQVACEALRLITIREIIHSVLGIPSHPVADDWTTILYLAIWRVLYGQDDVDALFNFSDFECGDGPNGLTLCPEPNNGAVPPGDYHVFAMVVNGEIPKQDPTNYYQYAFVFDSDGNSANNYQPSDQAPNDFFKDTDRWYEAAYDPASGWQLEVTDARDGMFVEMASDARLIIEGNTLLLLVPAGELASETPSYRATAFRHGGDYGIDPPHDYDGSIWPSVADGLEAYP